MKPIFVSLLATALAALPAAAQNNPHDGMAFWLPNGVLKVGDAASEKAFRFERQSGRDTFTVPLRRTRFDVSRGDLYVVPVGASFPTFTRPRPAPDARTMDVSVTVPAGGRAASAYRLYWSDDASVWKGVFRPDGDAAYTMGIIAFFRGDLAGARSRFGQALKEAGTPEQARWARRWIRRCDAEARFPKIAKADGKSYYNLGLYAMVNGFWELAEKSFRAATVANPKDADAWYMLGDAVSYVHSDLDENYKAILPYYRKAADLYRRPDANTFRNHLGLFKKLKVREGDRDIVLNLTPEQIRDTKDKWEFCTAVFEASARGSIRMVNNWVEYDEAFDNTTSPSGHDPAPFQGLFPRGTVETFMKFAGWGASDALGHDCGPDRSATVNIGMREWDVLFHEWNHTLDWLMIFSGLGKGVPDTHASDGCGFQPISSMGMGHHSCNRYFMTPGMYRAIRGTDPATTPWIEEWLITDPVALPDAPSPISDADHNRLREASRAFAPPISVTAVPDANENGWAVTTAMNGYVDLGAIERQASRNATSFAHVYVWSPADMKARVWFGADDNARIWVNNALAYEGVYWAVTGFEEAREKDQIATAVKLRRGWNSVLLQVTNLERAVSNPPPPVPYYYGRTPDAWGFSMRLCDFQNRPIEGMRWQASLPPMFEPERLAPVWSPATSGKAQPRPVYHKWSSLKDDYTMDLARLTLADLRAITGYSDLTISTDLAINASGSSVQPGRRLDSRLDARMPYAERIATLRYTDSSGNARDMVFLRPDIYEAFFRLAKVAPEARARGIGSHEDRVIGWHTVEAGDSPNGRIVLVVDTVLGWSPPEDEEDLLGFGV